MPGELAGRSILIVGDEPLIAMEITQAFKDAGAAVTTTNTLKQALILVEHDGLAAAILDHALDDGDSTLLCQRLKERDVPFVIYSGFDDGDGVCAQGPLISKPASVEALIAAVEGLLQLEGCQYGDRSTSLWFAASNAWRTCADRGLCRRPT
jgi:DNA-binding response OmpR family regulator